MEKGNLLLGFLAGVSVGAILGILYAPDKGSSTRKNIIRQKDEYIGEAKHKFDDFVNTVTDKFENKRRDVEHFVENNMMNSSPGEMADKAKSKMK